MTSPAEELDAVYHLLRARRLGMFIARGDDERDLLSRVAKRFGADDSAAAPPKPVRELRRLTDSESRIAQAAIAAQTALLREAHMHGMAVARDDEQREVLAALRELIGPPRDG